MESLQVCQICHEEQEDMRHVSVECFYDVKEVVSQMEEEPFFKEVPFNGNYWGITRTYAQGTRDEHKVIPVSEHEVRLEVNQVPIDAIRLLERRMFTIRCCKSCRADFLSTFKDWASGSKRVIRRESTGTGAFARQNGTIYEMTEEECQKFEQEHGQPPLRVNNQ